MNEVKLNQNIGIKSPKPFTIDVEAIFFILAHAAQSQTQPKQNINATHNKEWTIVVNIDQSICNIIHSTSKIESIPIDRIAIECWRSCLVDVFGD